MKTRLQSLWNTIRFSSLLSDRVTAQPNSESIIGLTNEETLKDKRAEFNRNVAAAISRYQEQAASLGAPTRIAFPLQPYIPPAGVVPTGQTPAMATDTAWQNLAADAIGSSPMLNSISGITASVLDGMGFPGFPYLTELTQLTEYRDISERTAAEMTRKWMELKATSDAEDKTEVIKRLDDALKRYHVRDLFREAATIEGFMGRAQIFIDLGETQGDELKTPLMLNKFKVAKGSLRGFKLVEPITTYPATYNASNPLSSDYYQPSAWFVYGQQVHASRLLQFVSRPLPDLLKPVYNFSGMSLSQLAQPYVDYWLGTRDSVGKLLRNFSITVLKTNLDILLSPSGQELINRVQLFTKLRDNQGIFMVNKDQEDLMQLNTPLSGLDKLQAQAQEHMAAVAKTPLVVLLGITPSGLNASSEGEIRVYYDYVHQQQEKLFRLNLEAVLKVIMLSEFGEIDEAITFEFVSLYEMKETEKATINKTNADAASVLSQAGVISPLEIRKKIAGDPSSGYDGLDADTLPLPTTVPGQLDPTQMDPGLQTAGQVAVDVMTKAEGLLSDGGFRGNQHIGGVSEKGDLHDTAMQLSRAATKASKESRRLGTRRAHQAASSAHRRALEAHQRSLSSADVKVHELVHQSYIDAHRVAKAVHDLVG